MASKIQFFFLLHILTHLLPFTVAQPDFLGYFCTDGNYTRNSMYETNLNSSLSSISSLSSNTTVNYGFYNSSVGQNSDAVYAISLCRGDVELNLCRGCVNDSIRRLREICPTQKGAVGWYDNCMLRYSNQSFFHRYDTRPASYLWNTNNASNVEQFNQALRTLMDGLRNQAAQGGSARKFATRNVSGPDFDTIFGLVQCTPDLSEQNCWNCLSEATREIPRLYNGSIGGRVLYPSCNIRHEVYQFYNDTDLFPPPPSLPSSPSGNDNTTRTIIIIVIPIVIAVILLVCICIFLRKRKQRAPEEKFEAEDEISGVESLQYDFGIIRDATDNFSDVNKLGQGGFGAVYKGKLPSGQEIAVKRLSNDSGQGELEFKNEALLVAKLQHRNLVRLLGFSLEGTEKLLIYEFVANASLDHFIFDPVKRGYLDWDRRYKIIGGIARGLLYLHEDSRLRIIHRDLKASNVLLDVEMIPKISDFGMARLFVLDETQGDTNRIVGTYGYMAPEYAMHGHFSVKSDVFSFGVLVLEIVSGQRNNCFQNNETVEDLLSRAWKNWRDGTASNIMDPALRIVSGSIRDIMRCIHIGLLCVQENVADRPTMASVVLMLNSLSLTLSVPLEPAFFMHSSINPERPLLSEYTNSVTAESRQSKSKSVNEASITELYPR